MADERTRDRRIAITSDDQIWYVDKRSKLLWYGSDAGKIGQATVMGTKAVM
ncbi:MAG: hypothetical protein ABIT38_08415 [Gemmatimonadaceae bacterium]